MADHMPRDAQPSYNQPDITIRQMQTSDVYKVMEMIDRTSPQSLYYRYLRNYQPEIEEICEMATLLAEEGYCMVAVAEQSGHPIVGISHYIITDSQEHVAEPAILIEDAKQGRGIGTLLFSALSDYAHEHGITEFDGTISANNMTMLKVVKKCRPIVDQHFDYGVWEIRIAI